MTHCIHRHLAVGVSENAGRKFLLIEQVDAAGKFHRVSFDRAQAPAILAALARAAAAVPFPYLPAPEPAIIRATAEAALARHRRTRARIRRALRQTAI